MRDRAVFGCISNRHDCRLETGLPNSGEGNADSRASLRRGPANAESPGKEGCLSGGTTHAMMLVAVPVLALSASPAGVQVSSGQSLDKVLAPFATLLERHLIERDPHRSGPGPGFAACRVCAGAGHPVLAAEGFALLVMTRSFSVSPEYPSRGVAHPASCEAVGAQRPDPCRGCV